MPVIAPDFVKTCVNRRRQVNRIAGPDENVWRQSPGQVLYAAQKRFAHWNKNPGLVLDIFEELLSYRSGGSRCQRPFPQIPVEDTSDFRDGQT